MPDFDPHVGQDAMKILKQAVADAAWPWAPGAIVFTLEDRRDINPWGQLMLTVSAPRMTLAPCRVPIDPFEGIEAIFRVADEIFNFFRNRRDVGPEPNIILGEN